jgi:hypothetical protein
MNGLATRGRLASKGLVFALALLVGLGPAPAALAGDEYVEAKLPAGEVPEHERLDIAIDLFSPSVDDHDRELLMKEEGIQPSVRKAEARYLAIHLRNTLQSTGQWGAVRVTPGGVPWAEVSVVGKIEKSNGKELRVRVHAWDATGKKWFDDDYKRKARVLAYAAEEVDNLDPFQSLYNEIANDLLEKRKKLKKKELVRIREVARLRFATEFAPDAFAPYLKSDRKGRYKVHRLPDESDPMLARLGLIRDRDDMFVDTLNEYYSDFYARMDKPYDDWRMNSYAEQAAYDSLNKSGTWKKVLGIGLIAAGIFAPGGSRGAADAKTIAMIGGTALAKKGFEDAAESKIHKAALEELAESFGADVAQLIVDVDGKVVELQGSAEAQFQQWRELLRNIAFTEAALPEDINVTKVPLPPEGVEPASPSLEADGSPAGAVDGPVTVIPQEPAEPMTPAVGAPSQES